MTRTTGKAMWILVLLLAALLVGWVLLMQPLVIVRPFVAPPVDTARLDAHLRMLSQTLYPRSFDQPDKLEAAASYIHDQFAQTGAAVEDQYFDVEGQRYRNVVVRFGPKEGALLVIGAHYDSHGMASEGAKHPKGFAPETHTPGADDNASGVAGLIELARLLAASPPPQPVELVAYSLEEPPWFRTPAMGSACHAEQLRRSGRPVRLMIALEMIGYFSDAPGSQRYPLAPLGWIYPTRGDYIGIIGRFRDGLHTRELKAAMRGATDLPVHSMNALAQIPGVDFSDHRSYWNAGFPALMVTDTAFYRNPNYHQAGDTVEKLDLARMAKVVQGVFAATR
jgi:Zn-dependent M28 family amino/carboxypeptidase